ncbi:MAG: beta-phosphoglucomutase family hydrolase [Rhodobacterales bacterium]|nr:beta-phosphoglucomutase family hydrolase [Rhodobacterales bacterium]
MSVSQAPASGDVTRVTAADYDAVLFDLDGVITDTAHVHSVAWKDLFDDYLKAHADLQDIVFEPFDVEKDYRIHVDGRPRYEGVDTFLRSRGIVLPWGDPSDPPEAETVCGLGNKKNNYFHEVLKHEGAEVFDSTVAFCRAVIAAGLRVAVVSSSKNCKIILDSSNLTDLFEVRIDGIVAERDKIAGKPKPDTYLEAARRLGVTPERSVVIEDAISGVQAGRAGHFGLVVGVDRHGEREALLANGAHVVVEDMAELST